MYRGSNDRRWLLGLEVVLRQEPKVRREGPRPTWHQRRWLLYDDSAGGVLELTVADVRKERAFRLGLLSRELLARVVNYLNVFVLMPEMRSRLGQIGTDRDHG